jgi:hypothetical protein
MFNGGRGGPDPCVFGGTGFEAQLGFPLDGFVRSYPSLWAFDILRDLLSRGYASG